MRPPLIISVARLRAELSGRGFAGYLSKLGDEETQDEVLESLIREAQGSLENDLGIFLGIRRIGSQPFDEGKSLGTDYDVEEDTYPYFAPDWRSGGTITLRRKPIVTVEKIVLQWGTLRYYVMPHEWQLKEKTLGKVHIQPLYGSGSTVTSTLNLVMLGATVNGSSAVPGLLSIDYTAGYFPADFDANNDDPYDYYIGYEFGPLLRAVRMKAAASTLMSLQRAVGAGGGSISMDGFSQSFQGGRFQNEIEGYNKAYDDIVDREKGLNGSGGAGGIGVLVI